MNKTILANPWNWIIIILIILLWYYGMFSAINKKLATPTIAPVPTPTPTATT